MHDRVSTIKTFCRKFSRAQLSLCSLTYAILCALLHSRRSSTWLGARLGQVKVRQHDMPRLVQQDIWASGAELQASAIVRGYMAIAKN